RTDTEEPQIEQAHRAGEHALSGEPFAIQILFHPTAELRKRSGEVVHLVELLPVPPPPPALVIQVLLSARGVGPGRLEVAEWIRRDPHVRPGGRDGERADPVDDLGIRDRLPPLVNVGKAPAPAASGEAGRGGVGGADPGRRLHGGLTTTREGNDENMPPPQRLPGRETRATPRHLFG